MDEHGQQKPSMIKIFWQPSKELEKIHNHPIIRRGLLTLAILGMMPILLGTDGSNSFLGLSTGKSPVSDVTTILIAFGLSIFATAFGMLVISAITWVYTRIVKSDVSFTKLYSMHIMIGVVPAVGALINSILMRWSGSKWDITSLAGVLQNDSIVLADVELFYIWSIILTAIGLKKVAGVSNTAAWLFPIAIFLISLSMGYFYKIN
jgi:hypothetical protein